MFELHKLRPSNKDKRKRVGRGGSRGGTSGKGNKGQKARSGGGVRPSYEGGQMPLHRRLPKRGFTNARFTTQIAIVNLSSLDRVFVDGDQINKDALISKGLIKASKSSGPFLIKVLGSGSLTKKVTVYADRFSASAIKAIESVGGKAHIIKGA